MLSPQVLRRSLFQATRTTARGSTSTTLSTQKPIYQGIRQFHAIMGKEGVHNLSKKTEFDEVLAQKDKLIVLDCFATWCGPCKIIAPQVVKFSDTYPTAAFYKLDVDEVPDVAQELGIRAMPTFILFRNGEKVAEVVGANPKVLEAAIKKEVETEGGEPTKAE